MSEHCKTCLYRHLSKLNPVIWLCDPPKKRPARDAIFQPGLNVKNPCYWCEKRFKYDDRLRERSYEIFGP